METVYIVASDRMRWKAGTRLAATDLAGCNIDALVSAGHLTPTTKPAPAQPVAPKAAERPKEQD